MELSEYIKKLYRLSGKLNLYMSFSSKGNEPDISRLKKEIDCMKQLISDIEIKIDCM